jgi:hypothetical protein
VNGGTRGMRRLNDGEHGCQSVRELERRPNLLERSRLHPEEPTSWILTCESVQRILKSEWTPLTSTTRAASHFLFPPITFLTLARKYPSLFDRNEGCIRFYEDLSCLRTSGYQRVLDLDSFQCDRAKLCCVCIGPISKFPPRSLEQKISHRS